MRNVVYSHPVGCEELNRMNDKMYEVKLENHETLDTIVIVENNGNFYHLDMLVNDVLEVDMDLVTEK